MENRPQSRYEVQDNKAYSLQDFFLFCAGVDTDVLSECPKSERVKHAAIGATVFFTGILAMISGGYALYFAFNSVGLAIAFGVLWGMVIFNIDRLIVATLKKNNNKLKEFMHVLPRIGLAIIIAIVISKPLELRLFQTEIEAELLKMNQEKENEANQLIAQNTEFQRVETLKGEINNMKAEIAAKQQQRDQLYQDYIGEAEGTAGTGLRGKGPVFREKVTQYNRMESELRDLKSQLEPQIAAKEAEIQQLNEKLSGEFAEGQPIIEGNTGLSARLTALERLNSPASWFIMLLFIVLECAPVFTKFIIEKGPYDDILRNKEHEIELTQQEAMEERMRNRKLAGEVKDVKVEKEIQSNTHIMDAMLAAHKEMFQASVDQWVSAEKSRVAQKEDKPTENPAIVSPLDQPPGPNGKS